MKCAWQSFLRLLPLWMRNQVDMLAKETLMQLHLRLGRTPELLKTNGVVYLDRCTTIDDLEFCVNAASRYSPWAATGIGSGFITGPGGHRMGVCGEATITDGKVINITGVTSIMIRVARDFEGIGARATGICGSTLIIGCPGSGKTTLLRDMVRQKSNADFGTIVVIDERKELFPYDGSEFCFHPGLHTDVLSGCGKADGIEMALRTMGPKLIAVDEITAENDCKAMIRAGWCGVDLLATAHARNKEELYMRPVYKPLLACGLFENLIVLRPDRSWTCERMV